MKGKIKTIIIELVAGAIIGAIFLAMTIDGARLELNRLEALNAARIEQIEQN